MKCLLTVRASAIVLCSLAWACSFRQLEGRSWNVFKLVFVLAVAMSWGGEAMRSRAGGLVGGRPSRGLHHGFKAAATLRSDRHAMTCPTSNR